MNLCLMTLGPDQPIVVYQCFPKIASPKPQREPKIVFWGSNVSPK